MAALDAERYLDQLGLRYRRGLTDPTILRHFGRQWLMPAIASIRPRSSRWADAAPRPLQHLADERAALHESLHGQITLQDRLEGGDEPSYLRIGLASSILRDLRRGRWVTQDEIDLHGLNRDEARQLLAAFLAESLHWGKRCVRIVHGKGLRSPQKISILRQLVRGWLMQRDEGKRSINHGLSC
jgi:DNA-nicking Smr family endonuclease